MKGENSQPPACSRVVCPECKRFFAILVKPSGEMEGICPSCHSHYYEQRRNNVRLIKSVKRQSN